MSFFRNMMAAGALVLAGATHATDVSMAGGSVNFSTPDQWVGIMETQGDPEVRVFQVPDPSPTANSSLARVTVTVKQVADLSGFQQYVNSAMGKAKALTGYQAGTSQGSDNFTYSAQENGAQYSYSERYWLKDNHAIQLRCVRPAQSQAGAAWKAAFDKGCDAIAARLK
ncbi:hypothetical protein ACXU4B_07085 [Dyella soli]|uniref:DUF1795 domain-containing protein n=1 Tax=Dyella soli TaxID=522319 RepID=A0A4R0YVV9_9GAMM|nr:hypothetical protein [Dyella soli]TCI10742.1 hypothetical protein EZM97_17985 [Dyella soli]